MIKISDIFLYSIFVFLDVVFFFYADTFFPLTFLSHLILIASVILVCHSLFNRGSASIADGAFLSFVYIFFVFSPGIQLLANSQQLVNTLPTDDGQMALGNLLITVFIFIYGAFRNRHWDQRRLYGLALSAHADEIDSTVVYRSFILMSICIIIAVLAIVYGRKVFLDMRLENIYEDVSPGTLIYKKIFLFLPVPFCLMFLSKFKNEFKNNTILIFVFLVLLLCVFASQNPITEKRNSLGPVYLSILVIFLRSHLNSSRQVFWLTFSAVGLLFPISSLFTHISAYEWGDEFSNASLGNDIIFEHFYSTHYDAWANFIGIIDLVSNAGYSMGSQLLASLLFFVPRSIWSLKPEVTGIYLGNYLINNYSMWFNNLSAPMPGEGYIDFGFIGLSLYAIFLAKISNLLDAAMHEARNLFLFNWSIFIGFFLVFALRGSLAIAISYGLAASASFYISFVIFQFIFRKG